MLFQANLLEELVNPNNYTHIQFVVFALSPSKSDVLAEPFVISSASSRIWKGIQKSGGSKQAAPKVAGDSAILKRG